MKIDIAKEREEKEQKLQRSLNDKREWVFKMIFTTKKPNKNVKRMVDQMRMFFRPETLYENENMFIREKDIEKFTSQMMTSHYLFVRSTGADKIEIDIVDRRNKNKITYKLIDYENNFKTYKNEIYKERALLSVNGFDESPQEKEMFEGLFVRDLKKKFRRVLLISKEDDAVYIRHYMYKSADDTKNYIVTLCEIGPRFTLRRIK